MFVLNSHPDHGTPLLGADAAFLGPDTVPQVERFLAFQGATKPTNLVALSGLAKRLGIASLHIKDESTRLGLGSFKALGGAYAVMRVALDHASKMLGRPLDFADLATPDVAAVARGMTVGCATDGNHGRSVAAGAQRIGARAVIFIHSGVSAERASAIAKFGAQVVRVEGTYDDSVAEASRVCKENGWTIVSDTSWPGYEHIPGLVMQGYTVMVQEALRALPQVPTHVFIQAGVGGLAAAVAGHMQLVLGERRPKFVIVEPARADCLLESARKGAPVKIAHGESTVMAMLECYEPSLMAWRVLTRCADAFMTVDEQDAVDAMRVLAQPEGQDRAIIAGESGGVGLSGLTRALKDAALCEALGLGDGSRVFLINTEGATDPAQYQKLVGRLAA